MPDAGTVLQQTAAGTPMSPSYGSFGNTKINIDTIKKLNNNNNENQDVVDALEDNDSGMSSEETDESLKLNLSPNNNDNVSKNLSSIVDDKQEVITKCLTIEPHCAEHRNEIPSCSTDVNHVSVFIGDENARSHQAESKDLNVDKSVSEYIVIDLTCDVDNVRTLSKAKGKKKKVVGTKKRNVDCDYSSIPSVASSQSLVPVANNEIANTENQKLLSLSLSILLAALLQAMRCFAQFLEDIVVPQR